MRSALPSLALLTGLALVLRGYGLGAAPLWIDEAYSHWFAQRSLYELWFFVPTFEVHPPVYYTLLHAVTRFADSEVALRLPSAIAGGLTVPLAWWLGGNVAAPAERRQVAFLAALLTALSPVLVHYGQEARSYALLTLAYALALAGLAHLIRHPEQARRRWLGLGRRDGMPGAAWVGWAALVAGGTAVMWLHYLGVVYGAALLLAGVAWVAVSQRRHRAVVVNGGLAAALVAAIWWPCLLMAVQANDRVDDRFWLGTPDLQMVRAGFWLLYGVVPLESGRTLALALFAGLAAFGGWRLWRQRRRSGCLLLLAAIVVPVGLVLAISYAYKPVFLARVVLGTCVPFLVALALGLTGLPPRARTLAAAAIVALVAVGIATGSFYTGGKEPWDRVARLITEDVQQGDGVIYVSAAAEIPVRYYLRDDTQPLAHYPLPGAFPRSRGVGAVQLDAAVRPQLRQIMRDHRRVWLVVRWRTYWDPDNIVLDTLRQERGQAEHRRFGRRIHVYRFDAGGET